MALNDLTPVIQEVVNRPGWTSGNSIALVLRGAGAQYGRKDVFSFEGAPANAARLIITYGSGIPLQVRSYLPIMRRP
jgi:hypothetical protein